MEPPSINSSTYWDTRFGTDWDRFNGPAQSRFFARLTLELAPPWLVETIRREGLQFVDWGCASGEGLAEWTQVFDGSQLLGVDFSAVAIASASERFPSIRFRAENWLAGGAVEQHDVIWSSNTLEHFHDPLKVLSTLAARAKLALVLTLPFEERDRIEEHFATFTGMNIPGQLEQGHQLVWARVRDCALVPHTAWSGKQIVLVYAAQAWPMLRRLSMMDRRIELADLEAALVAQSRTVELETRLTSLSRELGEARAALASATATATQRVAAQAEQVLVQARQNATLEKTITRLEARIKFLEQRHSSRISTKIYRAVTQSPLLDRLGARGRSAPSSQAHRSTTNSTDLSWAEFERRVLSRRASFKGVFVQELVIDWNVPLFQRPQHMATALGRLGYLVIYRTENWSGDDVNGFREIATNVWLTDRGEVSQISDVSRSVYSTRPHTPASISRPGIRSRLIYEYIDHIDPKISGEPENIRRLIALKEHAFGGAADLVVASARKLYEEAVAAVGPDRALLVPNGVDCKHYRDPRHAHAELPARLVEFRARYSAIVGYFGALAPWLWYDAIQELSTALPEVGFVFIGPDYYGGEKQLPVAENVLHLGPVEYRVLPGYARTFDVCFIPFSPGEIAKTTSPLKLFEYFALEKPVVVTSDMLECVAFPEVFHGNTPEALRLSILAAISKKEDKEFCKRLATLADENDWLERGRVLASRL